MLEPHTIAVFCPQRNNDHLLKKKSPDIILKGLNELQILKNFFLAVHDALYNNIS